MNAFRYWLKSRWRTRGEYAARGRGWLFRYGVPLAAAVAPILLGLLALGWILSAPSRSGAREVRIDALAERIVRAVEEGGHGPLSSLGDYVAAGVLTPEDVEFLAERNVIFHPITRSSPDTAVVFRRTRGAFERVHRKDGSEDHYSTAISPDGRFGVVVGPPPRGPATGGTVTGGPATPDAARGLRSVTVRSLESGRVIGSLLVPGHASAGWSPDGRFLAIEAGLEHESRVSSRQTFVLVVSPSSVRRMDLPTTVDPIALLAPEDRSTRFQSTSVRPLRWSGSTLHVESTGHGWMGTPGAGGSTAVTIRCRFALDVAEQGIREVGREVVTYAKS